MKRILVTGAGGAPATNFVRSLRSAPERFYLVGSDADPYYLMRAETDARYLVPKVNSPTFLSTITRIIKKERIEFIHIQNDTEVGWFSKHRKDIPANLFLPSDVVVRTCQDKFLSYSAWEKAHLPVPKTILINKPADLLSAFGALGKHVWLRDIHGAAGKGSLQSDNPKQAKAWIDFHNGWGHFTAASYLSPESVTWMSIWHNGKLILAQGRTRM